MKRFFNDTSFWNQPIDSQPAVDPESGAILEYMDSADPRGFWINLSQWTIPIYEVNAATPRHKVHRRLKPAPGGIMELSAPYLHPGHPMGLGRDFAADAAAGNIPIPDNVQPDPEDDSHIALVDWENGWIWDMWGARRREDGDWETKTGMKYRADGSGVFNRAEFDVHNGESIHPYGPSRAAGVPALAGTIMHQELLEGRIEHRLGFATQAAGLRRFVSPPACWTDGGRRRGIPEGAVLQLDPDLDLTAFNLSPSGLVIAKALQEYGAVCIDVCGGHCLYGQGLYADPQKRTWEGLLASDALIHLRLEHFRVLKMENIIPEGMSHLLPNSRFTGEG